MTDEDFKKFLEAQMSWDCTIINLDIFSWKFALMAFLKYNVSSNSKILEIANNSVLHFNSKSVYTINTIIQRKHKFD